MEKKRSADDADDPSPKKIKSKRNIALDIDALDHKHGLKFDHKDRLIVTPSAVKAGLFNAKALETHGIEARRIEDEIERKKRLEEEEQEEKNREVAMGRARKLLELAGGKGREVDDSNNNNNKLTSVLPFKLEGVCSANLQEERMGVSKERETELENERRKDMIYNLLTNNTPEGIDLLNTFVRLGDKTLRNSGCYPSHSSRRDDAEKWDTTYKYILDSKEPMEKRSFILACLYTSNAFVEHFCPRNGSGRFLTNPEKLNRFIRDINSPFLRIFADMVIPEATFESFASNALAEWMKLTPWDDMDYWSKASPTESSIEVRMLLGDGSGIQTDHRRHFLTNKGEDEPHPSELEDA